MFARHFFNEIDNFHRDMDQVFRGIGFAPASQQADIGRVKFTLREVDNEYIVEAVAAGLDSEKLDISVVGRKLTVAGEMTRIELPEDAHWLRQERSCGRFEQSFRLPLDFDREKIEASYENGILKIVLPKAASAQPKKIELSVA